VLEYFQNTISPPKGIDDTAFIHPSAQLGQGVSVGMFSIIEAHAVIGDGAYLHPQVYVGSRARLGKNVVLFPGARVMHGCEVGDNCIIHPNAVIGSDGFGFSRDGDSVYQKIPQLGNVIIEDNVEIGACTTIDRPAMGSTILHAGVKLDNLIQIGHGVTVGKNTVMAAQAGVAGSTHIGENCQIGGQAGFIGHLRIADGLRIQAQSGIASSVKKPNQDLFGYPAIPYKNYVRSYAVFKQLPDLYKRLHQLEKLVKEMRGGAPPTDPEG
jgi:UDP-3-O-[3-hydroxymyristoyl] glucosamine N-acyltransferase